MTDFDESFYGAEDKIFDCDWVSVLYCVNKVLVYNQAVKTELEGKPKLLVAFTENAEQAGEKHSAFVTDSKYLRQVLTDEGRIFPFRAVIKVVKLGSVLAFKFFSPKTQITEEDINNLKAFEMSQDRRFKNRK